MKRAIALAVKYNSKSENADRIKTYLNLIDPLMSEEAEYIRKNLGPFAIGDGLLARFPKEILARCKKWILSKDESTKWNTAMIFTAAHAVKFKKEASPLIKILLTDESKIVSAAAKKAAKNLGL